MKKILLNPWSALLTLVIVLLVRWLDPSFVESVRLRYFDQLIVSQPVGQVSVNVVNIDESTLEKYGQWPFPRDIYAEIIKELYKRQAGLVVFNVLMPEKDRFGKDQVLEAALAQYPTILPNVGHVNGKNVAKASPVDVVGEINTNTVNFPGIIANIPLLNAAAAGTGIVNTFPEIDGVVRRLPVVIFSNGTPYTNLAFETLRVAAADTQYQLKIDPDGIKAVHIPEFGKIDTDALGRIWIDWSKRGAEYSYTKLPQSFNGEIVIVGLSAAGLVNPISTAIGDVWPQSVQASVLGTLMTKTTIQRPAYSDALELAVLAAAGLLLISLMRWTYTGLAMTAIVIGSGIFGSIYVFVKFYFLFDATAFAVGTTLVALHAYMVKFVSEFLQKQQIRKQFQSYLSPDLVAKLIKDPSLLRLGGEEKELSIMFTDVRGFTGISEHYGKNVQGLTSIMNRYMTAMTKKILENHGTLDKYIGDAQMAFWNAPLDETKHCKDAVKSALEMLGSLDEFNREIAKENVPAFGMGIGINTGVVVVGNMGSEQRFDYTCLGDAVNLASRLEGQSKNYGVKIVLGPVTAERLGDEYFTIELDCIAVKGKKEGVTIYTVFNNPSVIAMSEWIMSRDMHDGMLTYYRQQKWDRATELVNELRGQFDGNMDDYYELWLERIEEMRSAGLPAVWDGIFRANSK